MSVHIATERRFLAIAGLDPAAKYKRPRKLLSICLALATFCSLLIQLLLDRDNFAALAANLPYFITHCSYLCKLANFLHHQRNLQDVGEMLTERSVACGVFTAKIAFSQAIVKIFRVMCALALVFYISGALPGGGLLPGYLPFEPEGGWFAAVLGVQVFSICVATFVNSTLDTLLWMLIGIGSGQIAVLAASIRDIDYGLGDKKSLISLALCLRQYTDVIQYSRLVESTFSTGIFCYFLGSVICLCFTGFAIIITPMSTQKLFLLVYFIGLLVQVGMYCWYGHDLIHTSTEINDFVYDSNWYLSSKPTQTCLILLMERAKQPLSITCGGFVKLSLTTLMTILRSSYSYLAVLEHIYGTPV